MKTNHNFFSSLAFDLAETQLGKTKKNPAVGCIVVKNNSVISSGVTSTNGRPHAEYNALNKKINFKDSQMYITLEPCTHQGVTPPCTNIIKKKNVNKVYYCFNDPDRRTFKKAKKELNKKNIIVKKISINSDFYKSYFLNKKKNLPLIDAKIAISKDYYTINKKSKWITNTKSRNVGHIIRSKYDCILSTSETINRDNSLLNCRIDGLDNSNPGLIIIDRKLKLKKNLKMFNLINKRKTYIFTADKNFKKIQFFKKKGIKVFHLINLDSRKDFDLLIEKIYKLGFRRILVESGLRFLNTLIKLRLINYIYIFKSNSNLRNTGFNNSSNYLIKRLNKTQEIKINLDGEKLYKVKLR